MKPIALLVLGLASTHVWAGGDEVLAKPRSFAASATTVLAPDTAPEIGPNQRPPLIRTDLGSGSSTGSGAYIPIYSVIRADSFDVSSEADAFVSYFEEIPGADFSQPGNNIKVQLRAKVTTDVHGDSAVPVSATSIVKAELSFETDRYVRILVSAELNDSGSGSSFDGDRVTTSSEVRSSAYPLGGGFSAWPVHVHLVSNGIESGMQSIENGSVVPPGVLINVHSMLTIKVTSLEPGDQLEYTTESTLWIVLEEVDVPGCNLADTEEPIGVLDYTDAIAFLEAFGEDDPEVDLAAPFGIVDFWDFRVWFIEWIRGCGNG